MIIFYFPILILGEQSWILIHDNLDSEFIYLHLLKESNNLFILNGSGKVDQVFNGLSTRFFHSEFSLIRLLFFVFPSFWAYVINSFLVRLVGIVGMHMLIDTYFKDVKKSKMLTILIPVSFGLLSIYSLYGISVMGQPLLLWSFFNLKSNIKVNVSLIIIFLFPFYAHFAMTAPFLLIALFIFGSGHILMRREISTNYFLGIVVLFIAYVLANSYTIGNFISNDVVSHRTGYHANLGSLRASFETFVNTLLFGQYHSSTIFGLPILLFGLYIVFRRLNRWRGIQLILFSIIAIIFFHSIYEYTSILLEEHLHILTSFKFNRFTFLLPFLYYLILLISATIYSRINTPLTLFAMIFFLGNLYCNNEIKFNVAKLIMPESKTVQLKSFSNFFAEDIFKRINEHIGLPQEEYRVVSLGLHPSIAQFNGFYTLDSYQNNYPLSYKNNFRKVIEGELNKHRGLQKYYDNWGSRCYLFSSELKRTCYLNCNKFNSVVLTELNINTEILKDMGCQYLLSAVRISNANSLNLKFEKSFESKQSSIKVYLYQL